MEDTIKKEEKRRIHRSPGYPMISLEEAVQKAKILWDKDKKNPIPREAFYRHLGYKGGGYGARVLAAMKKYGLIIERKNDIILTQEAVNLALYETTSNEYSETLQNIALKPSAYEKLYNQYGVNLPSDISLRAKLINEYGFNPNSVDDFINNFKSTIEYAGLSGLRIQVGEDVKVTDDRKEKPIEKTGYGFIRAEVPLKESKEFKTGMDSILTKSFDIPLMDGSKATILFDKYPLDEEDIDLLKKWFEIYAPALKKKKVQEEIKIKENIS